MARQRPPSRPQRWADYATQARAALDDMQSAKDTLANVLSEWADLQSEYGDWKDALPDNLQGSTLAEKLEAITGLDLEVDVDSAAFDDLSSLVDEAAGADLPLGFGRD